MRSKFCIGLKLLYIFMIWSQVEREVDCNPLAFSPNTPPIFAVPHMQPFAPSMIINPDMSPFASMPAQYFLASPFGPMPIDATRRSLSNVFKPNDKPNSNKTPKDSIDDEDQKDPLSYVDPDPPASFTERISDSFSALGEGVKNHFRSMTENFSDTMDEIKDAWRSSEPRERRG